MDIRFDEYNAYLDTVIQEVTDAGIQLTTGQYIDYADCADHFFELYGGSGKCVGERNAQELTIIFYTAPLTTHITFSEGGWLREFFRKDDAAHRFHKLCKQICEAGYTTRDES